MLDDAFWPRLSFQNKLFWALLVAIAVVQTIATVFGGAFTQTVPLDGRSWAGCLLFASLVLPFGALLRLVPVCVDEI